MKIIIIGAGLGGLAAAISTKYEGSDHEVLVIEAARELTEIGAGLQVTPNATRLLLRWGLSSRLEPLATCPRIFTAHRYSNGKLLAKVDGFGQKMLEKCKAPFWDMHRADLQKAMYSRAVELGVQFRFGTSVVDHDFSACEVTFANGEKERGDLLVAANGLWSPTRAAFFGRPSPPLPTGDLAYRILLRMEDIHDEELRSFASIPRVCLWAGPGGHVIYYPLKDNTLCNIVLLVPDDLPEGVAKTEGDLDEMKAIFESWDPRLQKFLSMVERVDKWKLMYLEEMDRWYNDEATVVFLGDACHPMLPYMAQGAGSALEDGATLGVLLSRVSARGDLPEALKLYETLRKPRSAALQKGSMRQRHINHLPDGDEQRRRDDILLDQVEEPRPGNPFYWIDPNEQASIYGYDVYEELRKAGVNIK
ncbi:Kynurenine 3-monooxygenase [Sphaceloma murrayae]|uniref:Kynurenine 3-monooxygenase n=1 Tax=Sphaceloma murrayae TaxID=2082308 RepID=A0A2K1QGL3_9PEZI|nr:Kynurenine 3-monooxygenase [Sphaceloma murrayae]